MDLPQGDRAHLNPDWNADQPQATGLSTLMTAVEGVHFPVDKEVLMRERGDATVDLTGDRPEKLRVLLLRTEGERFMSVTDLVQQLEGAL